MKILYTTLFILVSVQMVNAQIPNMKWGKYSKDDVRMTEYNRDKAAEAVILAHQTNIQYEVRSKKAVMVYNIYYRIKILTKEGAKLAKVEIPFTSYQNKEKISNIRAQSSTYRNGRLAVDKLSFRKIETRREGQHITKKQFTIPRVAKGSIIEYRYTIVSTDIINLKKHYFQYDLPTIWSELNFKIPSFCAYKSNMNIRQDFSQSLQKSIKYDLGNDYSSSEGAYYAWALSHVPALKTAPFVTHLNDYRQFIHLFLNAYNSPIEGMNAIRPTWKDVKIKLIQDARFGTFLNPDDNDETLSKTINELLEGSKTQKDKTNKIFKFIKQKMDWNGKYSIYSQYTVHQLLERKTGNSAEINLLLLEFLKQADIEALPVLISTRKHGKPQPNFPYLDQFNTLILQVEIDGKKQLLDATPKYLTHSKISFEALNGQGLLMNEGGQATWINIPAPKNRVWHDVEFYIQSDGTVKGKWETIHADYSAAQLQKSLDEIGDKNAFVQKFVADLPIQITQSQVINIPNKTLKIDIDFEANQLFIKENDAFIFQPFILSSKPEKPLKTLTRDFDTNFGYHVSEYITISMYLPREYILVEKPKSMKAKLLENGGNYTFTFGQEKYRGDWYIRSNLHLTKGKYQSSEYTYLQEFLTMVFNQQQVKLVFKKEQE